MLGRVVTVFTVAISLTNLKVEGQPDFFRPDSPSYLSESITEDIPTAISIYNVFATGGKGFLTYSIQSQNPAAPAFTLTPRTLSADLYTPSGTTLDRETVDSFEFVFSVTDGTDTVLSDIFTVNILDVNDNAPQFENTTYTATIYDTVSNGFSLLTVSASDADATPQLKYYIRAGDKNNMFSIGQLSGLLTVTTSTNLQASSTQYYVLRVEVEDNLGTNTGTATIRISVIDDLCDPNPCTNSGTCTRDTTSYSCTCTSGWSGTNCDTVESQLVFFRPDSPSDLSKNISEDLSTGTSIYNVFAFGGNGTLTYRIQSQNPTTPVFTLTPTTSSADLNTPSGKALDRETVDSFDFVFSVTDDTYTVLSATFTVNILDVNDNAPQFEDTTYTATIYDTVSNGYSLLTVSANDADATTQLIYYIRAGDSSNTFSIDKLSGHLTVTTATNLRASTTPSYILRVEVEDTFGTNTGTATISISVIDDLCDPNPCQNSGTCARDTTSYNCTFTSGWFGTNCSTDHPCDPQPCLNGGTCSVSGKIYTCSCPTGWIGETCKSVTSAQDQCEKCGGYSVVAVGIMGVVIAVFVIVSTILAGIVIYMKRKLNIMQKKEVKDNHMTEKKYKKKASNYEQLQERVEHPYIQADNVNNYDMLFANNSL